MGAINRGLLPGPFQSGDDQVVTDSLAQEATRCQEKTFVRGQKVCQDILLYNDTLPKVRRARALGAFGESTTSQLESPSSTDIE